MTRSNPLWNHAVLDVYVNMLVPSGALSCFELYYVLAIRSVVLIALLSVHCYCHVCFDGWFVDSSLVTML